MITGGREKIRAGILSDSHGDLVLAKEAVQKMGQVDLLIHAGDYYRDALCLGELFGLGYKAVAGNCDRNYPGPEEEIFELGSYKIYLTHGHLFGVKMGLMRLYYRAVEIGADIVIFGHTHVAFNEKIDEIFFLNPGSISRHRDGKGSFAVLDFGDFGYKAEICSI